MSTKDISRSALEGGRASRNKDDRNESHRRERANAREWLGRAKLDSELYDNTNPETRPKVSKEFTDKLNPCYRWLASRCGRPWSEVFKEIKTTFDTRKLSAWHIVNQHMITEVRGAGTTSDAAPLRLGWRHQRFEIDNDGILRDLGKYRQKSADKYEGPSRKEVLATANGRGVIDYGAYQFWAEPSSYRLEVCSASLPQPSWSPNPKHCPISDSRHRKIDVTPVEILLRYSETGSNYSFRDSVHWRVLKTHHQVACRWRQGKKFTEDETNWWRSITPKIREIVVIKLNP